MTTIAVVGEVVADAVLPPDGIRDNVAHLTVHPGGGPANFAVALARLGTIGPVRRPVVDRVAGLAVSRESRSVRRGPVGVDRRDRARHARHRQAVRQTARRATSSTSTAPPTGSGPPRSWRRWWPASATDAPVAIHTGTLALALQPSGAVIEDLLAHVPPPPHRVDRPEPADRADPGRDLPGGRSRTGRSWPTSSGCPRTTWSSSGRVASPEQAAATLHEHGVALAVVSLGADGAFASLRGEVRPGAGRGHRVVDTVGAGDSFHGGLLHHLGQAGHLGGRLDAAHHRRPPRGAGVRGQGCRDHRVTGRRESALGARTGLTTTRAGRRS